MSIRKHSTVISIFLILLFVSLCFVGCNSSKISKKNYPDCSSTDIEKVDSCLLGLTIRQAIEKLKLDTAHISTMQEPLLMIRGIDFMPDSNSRVELFVEKTSIVSKIDSIRKSGGDRINPKYFYQFIMERPILTIRWTKDQGLHEKVLSNPR